ncbi:MULTISPECIES: hypothetical protein [unclassified Nostoc]|uniref:hypothetical protein n=1 Tax=unclassified Nostoc TaxID=2593658 RepID=UPI0026262EA6|nr:hypothetical protein [Nostoc sp. S13]MDF5734671.1 hypothetical protein [Nostoc sp. S13]
MTFWIREWGWGVGSRESGVGSGGDEGDEGDKEKITNAQCPIPNPPNFTFLYLFL